MNRLEDTLNKMRVVRFPKHRIATFGDTRIEYYLLSEVMADPTRTRLRKGHVVAEKPKVLTADSLRERFEGFGAESSEVDELLSSRLGRSLRALEYRFRNELNAAHLLNRSVLSLSDQFEKEITDRDAARVTLLIGPESHWGLTLVKFIVEEIQKSARSNLIELEEHGFFDPAGRARAAQKREIENLFRAAESDRGALKVLAQKLKSYELFEDYEDRFFRLAR